MAGIESNSLIGFYRSMLKIRMVEETLMEVFSRGEIPGFIHVCVGQEAAPVALCAHLADSDFIASTHRGHGHAIAKGIHLSSFMAELFGKANGLCLGRSGSMHVADHKIGVLGANGIVGGGIPIATGAAFAAQYRKTGQVTVCFFGEGATSEGVFHESLNLASLWALPIVYVCENNGWAQFTYKDLQTSVQNIADRAASYNIHGVTVSNDFLRIYDEAGKAVQRARQGKGPTLLEVQSHRIHGHFVGDTQKYRPEEDVKRAREKDCLQEFEKKLLKDKILEQGEKNRIAGEIQDEIEEALAFARKSPLPENSDVVTDMFV
jgi:TPP-dependent pyruvate/acetoin dehydrogenase alpha subunit